MSNQWGNSVPVAGKFYKRSPEKRTRLRMGVRVSKVEDGLITYWTVDGVIM